MTIVARLIAAGAAAAALLPGTAPAVPAAAHVVIIDKMRFGAVPLLRVGETVMFVNKDIFQHTVTAQNGAFNLDLAPGKRASIRIHSRGTAAFFCKYHPGMRGIMKAQ